MPELNPEVVSQVGAIGWEVEQRGRLPVPIVTEILSNHGEEVSPEAILLVTGYGEDQWSLERALDFCAKAGQPAVGTVIDMEQIGPKQSDIETFIAFGRQFAPVILSSLNEQGANAKPRKSITRSLSSGILGLGMGEAPELVDDVVFMEPVGHDLAGRRIDKGTTNGGKLRRQFVREFAHTVAGPHLGVPASDIKHAAKDLGRQIATDLYPLREHRFRTKLSVPVMVDCGRTVLKHVASGNNAYYIFGMKDPLSKGDRVLLSLSENALDTEDPEERIRLQEAFAQISANAQFRPGNHGYTGWPRNQERLGLALQLLKRPKWTEAQDTDSAA